MVEKILNNTTPYGKIRASHEGSLHSSTLMDFKNSMTDHKCMTAHGYVCRDTYRAGRCSGCC